MRVRMIGNRTGYGKPGEIVEFYPAAEAREHQRRGLLVILGRSRRPKEPNVPADLVAGTAAALVAKHHQTPAGALELIRSRPDVIAAGLEARAAAAAIIGGQPTNEPTTAAAIMAANNPNSTRAPLRTPSQATAGP